MEWTLVDVLKPERMYIPERPEPRPRWNYQVWVPLAFGFLNHLLKCGIGL